MKWVFQEIGRYKKMLIFLILMVIISSICSMLLPYEMQVIIDTAIPKEDTGLILGTGAKMLVFVVVYISAEIILVKASANISMGVGSSMRRQVFDQVQSFSQQEIDHFTTASLITRSNSDINQVQTFLSNCFGMAINAPLLCITGMIMAIITSPTLCWALVIAIPVLALGIFLIGKKAIPLSVQIQKKLDRINMVMREKLTGVRVIRAFGTRDFEEKRFDDLNVDYTQTNRTLQNLTAMMRPLIILILGLTTGVVLFLAYYLNVEKEMAFTTGEIMAMIQYIMQILSAVIMLTIVLLLLPRATTSANRAKEVMDIEVSIQNPNHDPIIPTKKGYVEFKDVSFTYKGADVPAVSHLSFETKPGETTAIIGGTGMGKSTIINLIPRLYDVSAGQVLVDGVDVRDYQLDVLRKKIGFVPQKAVLFKGTIDSNIAFGGDNPPEERIEEAVRIAQSWDFVTGKEKGFESDVAQGGSNFSGGQKQRLCIARAIVDKPEIYIFDDSFSALDFKTDKALRAALNKETGEAAVIIVAQRVGTIMDADRIIVIERGEVAGIGTHHELFKNCDVYKEIVASQMSAEEMEK